MVGMPYGLQIVFNLDEHFWSQFIVLHGKQSDWKHVDLPTEFSHVGAAWSSTQKCVLHFFLSLKQHSLLVVMMNPFGHGGDGRVPDSGPRWRCLPFTDGQVAFLTSPECLHLTAVNAEGLSPMQHIQRNGFSLGNGSDQRKQFFLKKPDGYSLVWLPLQPCLFLSLSSSF